MIRYQNISGMHMHSLVLSLWNGAANVHQIEVESFSYFSPAKHIYLFIYIVAGQHFNIKE